MKISRREFLKYCVSSAAVLGLDATVLGKLEKALAANIGPHVLWLSGASCTGCSVSLANLISTSAPKDIADLLINVINLDYHPNLMGAAGDLAVQTLRTAQAGSYILAVEGCIPTAFNGNTCILWNENGTDVTALAAVKDLASKSIANISIGTCSSFGGMCSASPNPTQAVSLSSAIGKSTINIPGCPTHPDWIVSVIAQLIAGTIPALDSAGRPTAIFGRTVHDNCPREDAYEDNRASQFGQAGACLRNLGCHGPETRADCPSRRWNNKTNFCINANSLCLGCTEKGFPDTFSPLFKEATTATIPAQKALAVSSAAWDSANQVLTAAGTGKIGSQAVVKNPSGILLAATMIRRDGTWAVSSAGLASVPTSVVISSNGVSVNANVSNAPGGQSFAITAAQYLSATNQLTVSGTGTSGANVTISATGGAVLGAVTIPTIGSWVLTTTSPTPIPTSVTAVSNGMTKTASVTGIPSGTVFAITSASYTSSTNRITVSGTGTAGALVSLSATGGAALGTVTIAANGTWTLTLTSPAPIPTSVTAVSNGVTKTASVTGIPSGTPLVITSAVYTASLNRIAVNGTGTKGARVTVTTAGGTPLGSTTITTTGSWRVSFVSPTPIPTSINATSNGVTVNASVTGIPVTVALTITTAQWDRSARTLSVAGAGTPTRRVSLYDDATGRLLGSSTVTSSSTWSQRFRLSSAPRVVRAVSGGQTVRQTVTTISSESDD